MSHNLKSLSVKPICLSIFIIGKKSLRSKDQLRKDPIVTKEIKQASGSVRALVKNKINVIKNIRTGYVKAIARKSPLPISSNLMPIVSSMEVLQLAYANIKSNKGSMTKGTTSNTADASSKKQLEGIAKQLKDGTFKFPPVRRTYLPKPGKAVKKKWTKQNLIKIGRPLGMPDFNSKLVQEAIRLVLNAIYEPLFDNLGVSNGFREAKGCHDAIKDIRIQTQGMDTVIEGDIKGAFPSLDHDILITILRKRVHDEKLLKLIYDCCKAGIFDALQNSYHDPLVGVPQGGIVSPLLWNIYMHEFDKFILTDIQGTYDFLNKSQKKKRHVNNAAPNSPSYRSALYQRTKARENLMKIKAGRRLRDLPEKDRAKAITLKALLHETTKTLHKTPSKDMRKVRLRFYYVRYADDWVFFTNAKPSIANYIKNKIASFLKTYLKLTLAIDKTKITNLKKNKAKFLGFSIFRLKHSKIVISRFGGSKRSTNNKVCIGWDKDRVLARFLWKGYMDKNGRPREQPALTVLGDYEIIMRYNSIIAGYINFYAPMIDQRSALNYIVYILEYSCYKTLCQKHRTSIRKLLNKHGNPMSATVSFSEFEQAPNNNNNEKLDPIIPTGGEEVEGDVKVKTKKITLLTSIHYWGVCKPIVDKIIANLKLKANRDPALIKKRRLLC